MFQWQLLKIEHKWIKRTAHCVLKIFNCCSLMTFLAFGLIIGDRRAKGLRDLNDFFGRFNASHRNIGQ